MSGITLSHAYYRPIRILAPAMATMGAGIIIVLIHLMTDGGLQWALGIPLLKGLGWLECMALVFLSFFLTTWFGFEVMMGSEFSSSSMGFSTFVSLGSALVLTFASMFLIEFIERNPYSTIRDHKVLMGVVNAAHPDDPVVAPLKPALEDPGYSSINDGMANLKPSLNKTHFARVKTATTVLGIHDHPDLRFAWIRGWMTHQELEQTRSKAAVLLRDHSQGKDLAWLAAALALADPEGLEAPLSITVGEPDHE